MACAAKISAGAMRSEAEIAGVPFARDDQDRLRNLDHLLTAQEAIPCKGVNIRHLFRQGAPAPVEFWRRLQDLNLGPAA